MTRLLAAAQRMGRKIKSLDGIDEVATIMAQVVPGLAGPIAAFCILTPAIPLVAMGACGMVEEYQEACKEYEEIFNSDRETQEKLQEIMACSVRWQQVVAARTRIAFEASAPPVLPKDVPVEEVARALKEHEEAQHALFIAAFDKKYGWMGGVGMGGMLLGLLPASTAAGVGIASAKEVVKAYGLPNAGAVAALPGLAIASGTTFLAGQVAMFGYAASRFARGKAQEQQLLYSKQRFFDHAQGVSAETRSAIGEIFDKELYLNRKHSIAYGRDTMIGQGAMMTGTVLGLTGVAAPVGLACFAVGAPMTIVPAISRIVYEDKEEAFQGNKELPYANAQIAKTTLDVITKNKVRELETAFSAASERLAYTKFLSLVHHAIGAKGDKWAHLEKIVEKGDLTWRKGTGLQGAILNRVQRFIRDNKAALQTVLSLEAEQASAVIQANLLASSAAAFNPHAIIDTGQRDALAEELDILEKSQKKEGAALTSLLLNRLKSAWKAVRYDLAEKLIYSVDCLALQEALLQEENRRKAPARSFVEMVRPAAVVYEMHNPMVQPSAIVYQHYRALEQALEQPVIHQQQQQLKQFEQRAAEFTLVSRSVNKSGDTVYLWDDPLHKGEADYRITYIVSKNSGKLTILYGDKASAVVAADADVTRNTGVMMVDIGSGKHRILGDTNNHYIHRVSSREEHQKWASAMPSQRAEVKTWYERIMPGWGKTASYARV